jgi:amidase
VASGPGNEVFADTLSCAGPMGRTVTDVANLLSVLAGPEESEPFSLDEDMTGIAGKLRRSFQGTRLGWLGDWGGHLAFEPGVLELCRGAFGAFEAVGCKVEETKIDFPLDRYWQMWLTTRHWLNAGGMGALYANPATRAKLKPEAQWEIEGGLNLTGKQVFDATEDRRHWYDALVKQWERFDYLLLPTAQVFPFDAKLHWPSEINGRKMDTYHRWMEVVTPATLAGCPAISVPVGFSATGLPMGMQIMGRRHADLAVLQLAYAYEQATQWVQKRLPPLLA